MVYSASEREIKLGSRLTLVFCLTVIRYYSCFNYYLADSSSSQEAQYYLAFLKISNGKYSEEYDA